MIWRILPHATLCDAADQFIVLDIRQDRYFRVPTGLAATVRNWLSSGADRPADTILALLRRNAVLGRDEKLPMPVAERYIPASTTLGPGRADRGETVRRTGIAGVARAVLGTWIDLRYTSLTRTLERQRAARLYRANISPAALIERAAAFEAARLFAPVRRNCLVDTLALDRWLQPVDFDCRVVFGVTALPFAAHCWLQCRDTIINDMPDRVMRYTPILVV